MTEPVDLAKPALDAGLMTNDLEPNADLFAELELTYDHLLKIGGGLHQHRYACGNSVIKLNSHRSALGPAPSGFTRLRVATAIDAAKTVTTTDGVEIVAVPVGDDGVAGIEVTLRTDRPSATARLLEELGGEPDGDRYRIGESYIALEHGSHPGPPGPLNAAGFRYITVQVRDVEAAHRHLCSVGFAEGRAPIRLGDTAYISFITDLGGNWIELSQRASLTGPLPDVPIHR